MLYCLLYLKSKSIVHKDIKLGNFFLNKENDLILGDFGSAMKINSKYQNLNSDLEINKEKIFKRNGKLFTDNYFGTPNYLAWEIVRNGKYDFESDLWAAGVAMFYMKTGKAPFESKSVQETLENISNYQWGDFFINQSFFQSEIQIPKYKNWRSEKMEAECKRKSLSEDWGFLRKYDADSIILDCKGELKVFNDLYNQMIQGCLTQNPRSRIKVEDLLINDENSFISLFAMVLKTKLKKFNKLHKNMICSRLEILEKIRRSGSDWDKIFDQPKSNLYIENSQNDYLIKGFSNEDNMNLNSNFNDNQNIKLQKVKSQDLIKNQNQNTNQTENMINNSKIKNFMSPKGDIKNSLSSGKKWFEGNSKSTLENSKDTLINGIEKLNPKNLKEKVDEIENEYFTMLKNFFQKLNQKINIETKKMIFKADPLKQITEKNNILKNKKFFELNSKSKGKNLKFYNRGQIEMRKSSKSECKKITLDLNKNKIFIQTTFQTSIKSEFEIFYDPLQKNKADLKYFTVHQKTDLTEMILDLKNMINYLKKVLPIVKRQILTKGSLFIFESGLFVEWWNSLDPSSYYYFANFNHLKDSLLLRKVAKLSKIQIL